MASARRGDEEPARAGVAAGYRTRSTSSSSITPSGPTPPEAAASASPRQAPASLSASAAPTANTQKFEVASIKPCEPGPVVPRREKRRRRQRQFLAEAACTSIASSSRT